MEGKEQGFSADFRANNSFIPVLKSLENLPNNYQNHRKIVPRKCGLKRGKACCKNSDDENGEALRSAGGMENNPKKIKSCHINRMNNNESENREIVRSSNPGRTCTDFESRREKVIQVKKMYQELTSYLMEFRKEELQSRKQVAMARIYIEAAMILKKKNKWINTSKQIGSIHGLKIGDKFRSRAELNVVGIHQQFQAGIDYMNKDGKLIATSIVASGRYFEDPGSSDALIYSGHGGNPTIGNMELRDQRLEKGNLALKNSKEGKSVVRVIKGVQVLMRSSGGEKKVEESKCEFKYIYDGLYLVDCCKIERGKFGKLVFKFVLKRVSEQPKLTW